MIDFPASVLIPLLRQDDGYLEQAVRSACTQTAPCEVVVAKSPLTPPANLAVLARLQSTYPQLVIVDEGATPGMAGALNAAIRAARAERVGFLMSDDWLEPEAVAHCLPIACDIVSTGLAAWLADGVTELPQASVDLTPEGLARRRKFQDQAVYLSHFYLLDKAKVLAAGGLDESLGDPAGAGVDDFDLIWTLLERGASVGIVQQRLYNYRDHPGERLTRESRARSLEALRRILDKHGVGGEERLRALISHGFWFGKSLQEAIRQLDERRRGGSA